MPVWIVSIFPMILLLWIMLNVKSAMSRTPPKYTSVSLNIWIINEYSHSVHNPTNYRWYVLRSMNKPTWLNNGMPPGACIWTQLETATLDNNNHLLFVIHIMLLIRSLGIDLGHFAFWHKNWTSWLTLLHGNLPRFLIRYIFLIQIIFNSPLPSSPFWYGNALWSHLHTKCFSKCTRACLFHEPLYHYYKTSATWRHSIRIKFMSGGGKVTMSPTKYFQNRLWGSELAPRVEWKSSSSFYMIFELLFTTFNFIVVYVCSYHWSKGHGMFHCMV